MNDEEFIRAARALSSDHGLRILKALSDERWKIATEISMSLGIHTSTATKYLTQLYQGGLLERRVRKTGNRFTHEYHLRSPKVMLGLDVSEIRESDATESWDACIEAFHRLISSVAASFLPRVRSELDKLFQKLKLETGVRNLCIFDPECELVVAKRLVRRRMAEGQLDGDPSKVKEVADTVLTAVKSLCLRRMGATLTRDLFLSTLS